MKKQNRIVKIYDNFSKVELYFNKTDSNLKNRKSVSVIVDSRTFSGRYNISISDKQFSAFAEKRKKWIEQVSVGNLNDTLLFESDYKEISIEIKALSGTKIHWNCIFKPFIPDIEILNLRLETDFGLIRSFNC